MMYNVKGRIRKGKDSVGFDINVEGKSEKHAKDVAMVSLCSKQGLHKGQIVIDAAKPMKDAKEN
ncbi:50S ribosomal protein L18ae [Candidatus Mancarchaeum acidiphilum]|jgi:ribosomal protein L20A (L18A)|uniref:50S ribosomal protein L18ae n=1 Tax=Candidatus Mancarchaeum acidiphilum TaxID=1920749 RepID=A0A218NP06_9ARCH|nr:hypothetical protein [Candidatus Mancarchaeum acidiphilum]ASI14210.1 50S ribosomal protein L18ae [Candidatus Mancarchaeum acidiphilum]